MEQPADSPDAETNSLHNVTQDAHLQTHVIAKEEQSDNAEVPQPTDQLLVETHSLHNVTQDATLFNLLLEIAIAKLEQ
jgi:hypothetical protein